MRLTEKVITLEDELKRVKEQNLPDLQKLNDKMRELETQIQVISGTDSQKTEDDAKSKPKKPKEGKKKKIPKPKPSKK